MSTFIDEATLTVRSGNGGNGSATFHREKHVPRGGPNGADGGRGGNVVFIASKGLRTLLDFRYRKSIFAGDGANARQNKRGADGHDERIEVPVGTIVKTADGRVLGDLDLDGAELVVARGGRGGRGNLHFTTSVRQAPSFAENGEPGEEKEIHLELQLIASVGLVGLPNAGKSTLLAAVSAARPKVASYPFTTITPNLGVVAVDDKRFVMADLPGLIEGASEGHGLGHQFLKHVQRTLVLVHVVDLFPLDESDPMENFLLVEAELKAYSDDLGARRRLVALNKLDLGTPVAAEERAKPFLDAGLPCFLVSGASGQGLSPLLREIALQLEAAEKEHAEQPPVRLPDEPERENEAWSVEQDDEGFVVVGKGVERAVKMTNLANMEAVRFLHRRLEKMGVIAALREAGAQQDDNVRIGELEFEFEDWER